LIQSLFSRIIFIANALSLDVILGILASQFIVAQAFNIALQSYHVFALLCAVGFIYSVDHLFDLKKIKEIPVNPRRKFHYEHQGLLKILALVYGAIGLACMTLLEKEVLYSGLFLFTSISIYLVMVLKSKTTKQKELFVAILYALGIFLIPFSKAFHQGFEWHQLLSFEFLYASSLLIQYLLLALLNLFVFSFFEINYDLEDSQSSLFIGDKAEAKYFQNQKTIKFIFVLIFIFFVFQYIISYFNPMNQLYPHRHVVYFGTLFIYFTHLLLFTVPTFKNISLAYRRFIGDVSFLIPMLFFI
jgi:hypothetical protein